MALKFDERSNSAKLAADVARTEEKGPGAFPGEASEAGADERRAALEATFDRSSSVRPICAPLGGRTGDDVHDEIERARLIGDITRLIREPSMPENTRLAGLTLIGWLARRRPNEAPHALGIDEARESERRIRAKTR
jgi:hypothetical protein